MGGEARCAVLSVVEIEMCIGFRGIPDSVCEWG